MRHWIRRTTLAGAFLATLGPAAFADSDLWLHVRVDEAGGAQVKVNLPLALIEKAMPLIPEEHFRSGRVVIDDVEWTLADLRDLWNEVATSPDMTFVTVVEEDETVKVWKEGDYLLVNVREAEETEVDVRIPTQVIEALLAGDDNQLDIAGALRALAAFGGGEIVTVADRDDRVRVWVDDNAESAR